MTTFREREPDYKLLTTEEGIEYLSRHDVKATDWKPDNLLPERGVYVYKLNTGEIVLLEAGLCDGRPAFVFSNYVGLQRCLEDDFFPLPPEKMSWLEANAKQVQPFLSNTDFYLIPLHRKLSLAVPFQSIADCETAFNKVKAYGSLKSTTAEDHLSMNYYFALAMAKFFIEQKGYDFITEKRYAGYNPSYYIFLISKEPGKSERRDLFSATFRAIESTSKANFRTFYWYTTGIPPIAAID